MEHGTAFIDVICNHAMVEISDIRLDKDMAINPARFFRKMSFFMLNAIPRFNRPPEAREWLKCTAPVYDDMDYIVPYDYLSGALQIETELTEYEVVSAVKIKEDGYGGMEYVPIPGLTYDSETGVVSIPESSVCPNDKISIDFYTDGYFDRELGYDIKNILGLLVQVVWENRFANDFLIQQPKIKDRSFDVGNEANYMRASTERMRFLNEQVNQAMHAFERANAYTNVVLDHKRKIEYLPENP